jgi:hypothetical protein
VDIAVRADEPCPDPPPPRPHPETHSSTGAAATSWIARAMPRASKPEAAVISSNYTGSPTNLSHDPLARVAGAYLLPVEVREGAPQGLVR